MIKEIVCHPDGGFAEELCRESGHLFFDMIAWSNVHVASPSMLLSLVPHCRVLGSNQAGAIGISCAVS